MNEPLTDPNENINNKRITIRALRTETTNMISTLLNPEKYIPTENGLKRDWHGLAELCDIGGEKIPSLQFHGDPSKKVLEIWCDQNKDESTIDIFLLFLENLDRFDVLYEITPLIDKDIEFFKNNPHGFKIDCSFTDNKDIITMDDFERNKLGLPPQTYDAFVLFADSDIDFATELIETMEKHYNLKLCVKDRDLVGGVIEHDAVIELISKRCRRLVVIVSPSFFESPVHKYLFGLAQVEGIEQRRRKIIPCLIKYCDNLPSDFHMYVILNYVKPGRFYNFWEKLYCSIKSSEASDVAQDCQVLQRSMETLQPKSHVKFNSMMNLNLMGNGVENNTSLSEVICTKEPNASSTSSEHSIEPCNNTLRKKNSFYRKLKKMIVPKYMKNPDHNSEGQTTNISVTQKENKKKLWKNIKEKVAVAS